MSLFFDFQLGHYVESDAFNQVYLELPLGFFSFMLAEKDKLKLSFRPCASSSLALLLLNAAGVHH